MTKYIISLLIVLLLAWSGCGYNSLVKLDEGVGGQWANVESAYQRRADLIPNLVETVKGYADFEKSTLVAVTEARASATQMKLDPKDLTPENIAKFEAVQNSLGQAMSRLLVSMERYPELKANANFMDLQSQLEGTENRINTERNRFNEVTRDYNSKRRSFPTVLTAGLLGFKDKSYFKGVEGSDKAPAVKF